MCKLIRSFLLFATLCCGANVAALADVLIVKPTFYYELGHDPSRGRFASYQEPYAIVKAEVRTFYDPGTGLAHWRVTGIKGTEYSINGRPILDMTWDVLEYNPTTKQWDTWVPSPTGRLRHIRTGIECPPKFRMVTGGTGTAATAQCVSENYYPEPCDTCDKVGNPILPSTHVKIQDEVDYPSIGAGGLVFVRTYRSDRNGWQHNYAMGGSMLSLAVLTMPQEPTPPPPEPKPGSFNGCYWDFVSTSKKLHCYQPMPTGNGYDFQLRRGNGRLVKFGDKAGFAPARHINDRWTPVLQLGNIVAHDVYNAANESTERYSINGLIERITSREGHITRFEYVTFEGAEDDSNVPEVVLNKVKDHFGRELSFTYDSKGRMETMKTPANEVFTYAYDEASGGAAQVGNLTSVTYSDQTKRTYWYNEPEHTDGANLPFALTGITDENGKRFATFKYTAYGFAKSTERAGGVDKYVISSSGIYQGEEYRYVTDPLEVQRESRYVKMPGGFRLVRKSNPAGAGSPASAESRTYDVNENVDTITNLNGVSTKFTYDLDRNLEVTKTEAVGTLAQRKTTTEWHPSYRLPKRIAEPKRLTTFDYDSKGNLKTRSIQATTDESGSLGFDAVKVGAISTWKYTYNSNSQLETIIGPRVGGVDKTTYAYDLRTGDLLSSTNAAGHVTTFSDYDGNGRPRLITAPNRTTTRLSYSSRGWLESRTVSDGTTSLTTTYGRDNAGQLTSVTNPDNTVITYVYDDAHRLTDIYDTAGNKIHYVLNKMGSPLSEEVTDPAGMLKRQVTNQYDILNRLEVKTGGAQ